MAHGSGVQRRELYRTELNNASWDVPLRYQNLKAIGSGAYGLVCYAEDKESTSRDKRVAIKKLHRPFSTETHAKRAYREIMMLQHFHHENLICLLDLFSPTTVFEDFNEVYLVTPYLDADLNTIVQSQKLSDEHIQFLLYQILRGLKYIHSAGIIHRDLKPNNLGVNENVELKILDFGLARSTAAEMTGYVVCRWYRAPEIILNWMHYNDKVDIWSVGCILGEMLCGKPLFKGNDYIDQLNKILHLVGKPNAESMKKIASADARNYIESLPAMKRKDFHQVFRGSNVLAINLLERMLDLDPDTRIGVLEALAHPYMKQYADETDEPVAPPFDDSFEDLKKDALGWKELIYQAVMQFKPREPEML